MPTVYGFDGTLFGWSDDEADLIAQAVGTYKWAVGLPTTAQRGTAKLYQGQSATLGFVPVKDEQLSISDHLVRLVIGASLVDVDSADKPELFRWTTNGTLLVALDDSLLVPLTVGRHNLELWDMELDQPVSVGTVTVVSSILPG